MTNSVTDHNACMALLSRGRFRPVPSIEPGKTQKELNDMVNRLVDTGKEYSMEINIDKSLHVKINNRELKEVDHFKYLGGVLTRYGYCTREIKMIIPMVK